MLYREIMAVCSEIHTKHINTLCGQNAELQVPCGPYSEQSLKFNGELLCYFRLILTCDRQTDWRATRCGLKPHVPSTTVQQFSATNLDMSPCRVQLWLTISLRPPANCVVLTRPPSDPFSFVCVGNFSHTSFFSVLSPISSTHFLLHNRLSVIACIKKYILDVSRSSEMLYGIRCWLPTFRFDRWLPNSGFRMPQMIVLNRWEHHQDTG